MAIPDDFKEKMLDRVDLVRVVQEVVQLKKQGSEFVGLCPFHKERSPSFSVSPTKNKFHCFGCGAGGDAIEFMREIHGMTFRDAVFHFAGQLGLKVPEDENRTPQQKAEGTAQQIQARKIKELNSLVANVFNEELRRNKLGFDYMRSRGITPEAAIHFKLGYAPSGWRFLQGHVKDYESVDMAKADLVVMKEVFESSEQEKAHTTDASMVVYDRFRNRLMFPILSFSGDVVGFGGRAIDDAQPKYLNTSETAAFQKGRELYGFFQARKEIAQAKSAIVVEGYMDVVAMWVHGVRNAVASLGTACTSDQLMKLLRYTNKVTFCFDGDSAGDRAAVKAMHNVLPFMEEGKTIRFARLPDQEDPDSFIRKHGKDAFDAVMAQAKPLSKFMLETATQGQDMDLPEGRAEALNRGFETWKALPRGAFAGQMANEFARLCHSDPVTLSRQWEEKLTGQTAEEQKKLALAELEEEAKPDPLAKVYSRRSSAHPPGTPLAIEKAKSNYKKAAYEPGMKTAKTGFAALDKVQSAKPILSSETGCTEDVLVGAGLLLTMELFTELSDSEVEMLCGLGTPLSNVVRWLDMVFNEHGVMPWSELRALVKGDPVETQALKMVATFEANNLVSKTPDKRNILAKVAQIHLNQINLRLNALMQSMPADYKEKLRELMGWRGSVQTRRDELIRAISKAES